MKQVIAKDLKAGDEVWDIDGDITGIETKLRFVKIDEDGDALFEMVSGYQRYTEKKPTGYVDFPATTDFYVE